jgi:hypothetical protein
VSADLEDIINAAVDAGWRHRTTLPKGSFSGSCRTAARTAIDLYKQYIECEKERTCKLLDRICELEKVLNQVGDAVWLSHDQKLPTTELPLILAEVRLYMGELQKAKTERAVARGTLSMVESAVNEALVLVQNKEHLRKSFRQDAHWIRFVRNLRLVLQKTLGVL